VGEVAIGTIITTTTTTIHHRPSMAVICLGLGEQEKEQSKERRGR